MGDDSTALPSSHLLPPNPGPQQYIISRMVWHIGITLKPINNTPLKKVLVRVCNLRLLFLVYLFYYLHTIEDDIIPTLWIALVLPK